MDWKPVANGTGRPHKGWGGMEMLQAARARGFPLLEILVGLTILGALITIFSRLMSGSSRKLSVTASSFFAIQLANKVKTDLAEEAQINAAFLEYLENYPEMTSLDRVVEGKSVCFRHPEFRREA
jgi:hypothetical protein